VHPWGAGVGETLAAEGHWRGRQRWWVNGASAMSAAAGWRLCVGGPSVGGLVGRRHQGGTLAGQHCRGGSCA
jgi:hypothetical protein